MLVYITLQPVARPSAIFVSMWRHFRSKRHWPRRHVCLHHVKVTSLPSHTRVLSTHVLPVRIHQTKNESDPYIFLHVRKQIENLTFLTCCALSGMWILATTIITLCATCGGQVTTSLVNLKFHWIFSGFHVSCCGLHVSMLSQAIWCMQFYSDCDPNHCNKHSYVKNFLQNYTTFSFN